MKKEILKVQEIEIAILKQGYIKEYY